MAWMSLPVRVRRSAHSRAHCLADRCEARGPNPCCDASIDGPHPERPAVDESCVPLDQRCATQNAFPGLIRSLDSADRDDCDLRTDPAVESAQNRQRPVGERCARQWDTENPGPIFDEVEDASVLDCGCDAWRGCDCYDYDGDD